MKTKTLLIFSLAGNALLLGIATALISNPHAASALSHDLAAIDSKSLTAVKEPLPEIQSTPLSKLADIEATNLPVYVANLRAAGVPEQTVNDVFTDSVERIYAAKRQQLSAQQTILSSEDIEVANRNLKNEEKSLVGQLVGGAQIPSTAATAPVSDKPTKTPPQNAIPLAFAAGNGDSLNLTPQQQASVEGIRRNFVEQLGGANADPGTPEYSQRWQQAQPLADQLLKARFGYQAFVQFQRQAQRTAASAQ